MPGIALVLLLAAAAAAGQEKTLRIAFRQADEGFDPATASNAYSTAIVEAIGEGLFSYDYRARPLVLVPAAAAAFPEIDPAGLSYRFRLRRGIRFAADPAFAGRDRELTAADFVYSLKRLVDPAVRSRWRFLLAGKIVGLDRLAARAEAGGGFDYDTPVPGLLAEDRYTLRIRLTRPDPNFLHVLAMPACVAVAREAVAAYGDAYRLHPVGSNVYRLRAYRPGHRIVLETNPGRERPPAIGRIEIAIIEEPGAAYRSFLNGDLDYLELPDELLPVLGPPADPALAGIAVERSPQLATSYALINQRDPVLGGSERARVALRRAILLAYDRDGEIRLLRGGQALASTMPIPAGIPGHSPDYRPFIHHDPRLANRLLDRYGYRRGADGWRRNPDGSPLTITLNSQPTSTAQAFDEVWQRSLAVVGLRLVVRKASFAENLKAAKQCRLSIWQTEWVGDLPDGDNFMQVLYGGNIGQSNNACYASPTVDRLYERARRLPDSPVRTRLYRLMTRQMEYDGVWRLGVTPTAAVLIQPRVLGYRRHPILRAPWRYLDLARP